MPTPHLNDRLRRVSQHRSIAGVRDRAKRLTRLTYRTQRPILPTRGELGILLNRRGLAGRGVEVGVKQGEFSQTLLDLWRGRELISVDPWAEAPTGAYIDVANVSQSIHDAFYSEALERLARFGPRSSVWRQTGRAAAERVAEASLDFVYLDARHDRHSVAEDLAVWYPKVRPGGLMAGHDYLDGRLEEGEFGVRSAVDEFFGSRNLAVHSTFSDPPWLSWFVLVPTCS